MGSSPAASQARPTALRVIPDSIPSALRELAQWVVWRYDWRPDPAKPDGGQWAKVPYSARARRPAAVDKPESWGRFDQALAVYTEGGWDGIGFVFTAADPFAGVDLDKVRDPWTEEVEPRAQSHVSTLSSYAEVSPSGTGLHVIVRATLPPGGRRKGPLELYDRGRYFCVTGHHLEGTPETIEERTEAMTALHAAIFSETKAPMAAAPAAEPAAVDDEGLLEKARNAKNGARFTALFTSGVAQGEDHSTADLELCSSLAFWTGRDAAQMDRLFRRSALMRRKWNERHSSDGRTYGQMTIARAITDCRDVYTPRAAAASRHTTTAATPAPTPASEAEAPPTYWTMAELADAYVLAARDPHHRLRFGYPELDRELRGVAPGEVVAILARSGVGKTAFGLNLAERMTGRTALPTLLFSLEMPGVGIFERLASMTHGWPGEDIENRVRGEDPETMQRLLEVCERWHHMRMVDTSCSLDRLDTLIEGARSLWSAPLRLVVVDFAGLVSLTRLTSAYERVSTVATELKNVAKRHNVSLLVLYQLSRAGGTGSEAVTLSMARDSGVVEEMCDFALGAWRPELDDELDDVDREEVAGHFCVRVLKNRNRGPSPKPVTLRFDGARMRITSPTEGAP
jgi:putative DNA primase/helicase